MIYSSNRGIYLQMEWAAIFIDGGYFNRILKSYFSELNINYENFSEDICNELQLKRLRTYYYTCMPIKRKGKMMKRDIFICRNLLLVLEDCLDSKLNWENYK